MYLALAVYQFAEILVGSHQYRIALPRNTENPIIVNTAIRDGDIMNVM